MNKGTDAIKTYHIVEIIYRRSVLLFAQTIGLRF